MPHRHKIYDTDPYFSINPLTRIIKNETSSKITLIQHDHNSERFTFEIPRFLEEHDMSECNVVQVHYINIESGNKNQNEDVYGVTDLHIDPDDDDKVICSWLVSGNATKYVGSLNFVVRFSCVTDGVIEYAWNTAVFSGISVSTGIYNTDVIAEEYSDIISAWAERIERQETRFFFCEESTDGGNYDKRFNFENIYPNYITPVYESCIIHKGAVYEVKTVKRSYCEANKVMDIMPEGSNGGGEVSTTVVELDSSELMPITQGLVYLFDINGKIPVGVEVVKAEGSFDGETWFDFKRMFEIEPLCPYYIANTHIFYDENNGMNCLLAIGVYSDFPAWLESVKNYELSKIRITYKS